MRQVMLSTIDNPHSPFDDFTAWYNFDALRGYGTAELLARIVVISDNISEADQLVALENAIDEIVEENVSGVHVKVVVET